MRKVLTKFEISSQPDGPVGKSNQPVHWVLFAKHKFGYYALFLLDLGHSELELHSVYFFGFLTL